MSTSTRSVNSEMFLFFVTLPRTGLALASVPIRYLARRNFSELQRLQVVRVLCGI